MSTPSDWVQFYQENQEMSNPSGSVLGDQTTEVTTNIAAIGAATTHLSPEGRVGKPVRRRSRASRRTPTTLLNTDTSNFRAMVQQFTGGPSAAGPTFGFGFGGRQPIHVNPNPNPLMVPPPAEGGFHLQYHQQHHQNQAHMFSLNNNQAGGGAELFHQPRPRPTMAAAAEGFMVEGISSQVPSSRTASSNENRSNATFLF